MMFGLSKLFARKRKLTALSEQFQAQGYAIAPQLFSREQVAEINAVIEDALSEGRERYGDTDAVILHGPNAGQRRFLRDLKPEDTRGPIKINNLYLESEVLQSVCLSDRLHEAISQFLGGTPIIINSLNFLYGSQQGAHIDTWYMPPPKKNRLAVASICLEDWQSGSGELFCYPGSHKIEPLTFEGRRIHITKPEEQREASNWVKHAVKEHGLARQTFVGRAGDVFFWHAQLVHGGEPIANKQLTRRSLVVHFWCAEDVPNEKVGYLRERPAYLKKTTILGKRAKEAS